MEFKDMHGDSLKVGTSETFQSGNVISFMARDSVDNAFAIVWLTYEQAEELEKELARLRMAHEEEELKQGILKAEQELLQAKKVAAAETEISYRVMYNPMGFAQAVNPEPELRTFHITINGDDITIWKE